MSFEQFRKDYPTFEYKSYDIDESAEKINIAYHFTTDGLTEFTPRWTFKKPTDENFSDNPVFRRMIFSLGMVELVSYWKATCSPTVVVSAGYLDERQKSWWKKLYWGGLGEFFYVNGIDTDFDEFMRIETTGEEICGDGRKVSEGGNLISIGGGKDSIVSLELLSEMKDENYCYIINPRGATASSAKMAGYSGDRIVASERFLDREIVALNSRGFLNGHTPFSAIVAFSALVCAYMNDLEYIVLSNESSANESTVEGSSVNHQYSKSYEFEQDFISYEAEYIDSGCHYFSLLRPLTEFQIAKYFSKLDEYHSIFKSCNAGSKTDEWCCNCPKCLFVYLILSPFIETHRLVEIFGENLLTKEKLLSVFDKLVGITPEKPFECVGSREEVNLAVNLTIEKLNADGKPLPCLLAHYCEETGASSPTEKLAETLEFYDGNNSLPEKFDAILRREFNL